MSGDFAYRLGQVVPRDHGEPGVIIDKALNARLGPRYLVLWPDPPEGFRSWVNEAVVTRAIRKAARDARS